MSNKFACVWPSGNTFNQLGMLGDYVGGVWGTIISAITLIVVYLTWRMTGRATRLQGTTAILAEMLKTHDAIAESGEFSFWDRRGTPSLFLREFSAIYKQSRKVVLQDEIWSVEDRIDISYTFAFYGLSIPARHSLTHYGDANIKRLQDAVSALRNKSLIKHKGMFKGHQVTLSHYLRNLFGMYKFIDSANISGSEKVYLSKIVRTKLSNYDQALLALNIVSHLGRSWEVDGLVTNYKPFANVPERFFGFDEKFDVKSRFPMVIFEWEQSDLSRPSQRTFTFNRWTVRLETRPRSVQRTARQLPIATP